VFLDEPTTGLDPQARRNFWELVKSIRANGATIVLTTHYMDEAQVLCDDIAIMDEGKIITQGAPDTLLHARFGDELLHLPHGEIRRPNLEDLFLDLTGHSLRA
jgi:ABC-2 type transport system ATP-binding protein